MHTSRHLAGCFTALLMVVLAIAPVASAQQPTPEQQPSTDPPSPPAEVFEASPAETTSDSAHAALRLTAAAVEDGVILRWAPTTARAWHFANDAGYIVERLDVDSAAFDSLLDPVVRRLYDRVEQGDLTTESAADSLIAKIRATPLPYVYRSLAPDTLRPWPLERWGATLASNTPDDRGAPENRYAAIAAQMLHGESVVPTGSGPYARIKALSSEYENRYSFSLLAADLDATAARGLALRWTDEDATPDSTLYFYRVYPATQPTDFAIDTAYVSVGPYDLGPALPPQGLHADVTKEQTKLRWPKPSAGTSFTAYYVERADGIKDSLYTDEVNLDTLSPQAFDDSDFQRLTRLPYLPMTNKELPSDFASYADTTAVPTQDYTYRVYGITPFATESLPAQITVRGRDLTAPPAPTITTKEQIEGSTVRLGWTLPEPPPDLDGFEIGISNDPEGPFIPDTSRGLLPPSTRAATDSRAISYTNNFYVVTAVDTAGNRAPSGSRYIHLVDSIPPPPPTGLQADADTNGVVTVRWELGDTPDLMGYHIRQAHDPADQAVLETGEPLRDTVYVDTLKIESLTKESYYDVIALDQNSNQSDASRVRVKLPDVVPPTAPVVRGVTPTTESVELAWTASVSDDVARHLVLRRSATAEGEGPDGEDPPWTEQAALSATAETYTDEAVDPNREYTYLVVAEDSAGLRSAGGRPVQARPYDSGIRPSVEAIEAEATDGEIQLTWRYPNPADGNYWFVIYRGVADSNLQRYRSSEESTFADPAAREGSTYRYAVQVVYEDGGQSRLSEVLETTP